jgi:hypothetical protein
LRRLIGELDGGTSGPTVLCVGGLHGSEPAGAIAAERFMEVVSEYEPRLRGRLVAIRGNPPALKHDMRYVDVDLNRIWDPDLVAQIVATPPEAGEPAEFEQLRELHALLHSETEAARGRVYVLDLHTTSSPSPPFIWHVPGAGQSESLTDYGLPIVFDPMHRVSGTLAGYAAAAGHESLVAESGPHDLPEAVDYHMAILWITLVRAGCLDEEAVAAEFKCARDLLEEARGDAPLLNTIVQHHKIVDGDGFRMRPGYSSFDPVGQGQVVADDRDGEVPAAAAGRILMPLYRPPCEDGFMVVTELDSWPV